MKRTYHIANRLALLLAAMLLTAACSSDVSTGEPAAMLDIYVYPSDAPMLTRADEGRVDAYTAEKTVHELQIWVFRHSDGRLLHYVAPDRNNLQSGNGERFQVPLTDTEATLLQSATVDVYVLANGSSIGATLDDSSTRAEVAAATISGSYFGAGTSLSAPDIASLGLPMSGYIEDESVQGSQPLLFIPVISLTRCVSKVRFVFTQPLDEEIDFSVTGIQLDGNLIAAAENVFTANSYSISGGYVADATTFTIPAAIGGSNRIASLVYSGQQAQTYEDLIDEAVAAGELTQSGPFYLRESDRRLSGTIAYTADGTPKTATFTMDATPGSYNFSRNHTWIVFCYFVGGRLYVKPTVLPWTAAHDRLNYSTQGYTDMLYETYLRYDLDRESWTWNDTYVAVAYGFAGNNTSLAPLYSPLITLLTQNTNELRVQLDNANFFFVQRTSETTVSDGVETTRFTYTNKGQLITIPGSGESKNVEFYVLPTTTGQSNDNYANVMITEIHVGDGLPPTNIPFNHNLPGEEDHTTIKFYNPSQAVYLNYIDKETYAEQSGNQQPNQYWWAN